MLFGNYTWLVINQNQYPHVQINCITKIITPTNNLRYFCHFFSSRFHFQREWCIIIALLWGLLFFKYFNVWMYDKCTTEIYDFSSVSKTTFLKRMFSVHLLFSQWLLPTSVADEASVVTVKMFYRLVMSIMHATFRVVHNTLFNKLKMNELTLIEVDVHIFAIMQTFNHSSKEVMNVQQVVLLVLQTPTFHNIFLLSIFLWFFLKIYHSASLLSFLL